MPSIRAIGQDLTFAVRSLRRESGLATLVVTTLAFGIGATTALFAVVKSVLLRPLPYERPQSIAVVWSAWKGFDRSWLSYDEYESWKAEIPAFADVAIYDDGAVNLTGSDQPERLRSARVGANLFGVLGVAPLIGRGFTEAEDRPNGPDAAIVSYDLWSRRFGANPSAVGKPIEVNGVSVPLVGVLPPGFRLPTDFGANGRTELYRPLATDASAEGAIPGPAFVRGGGNHSYYALARLAPGATLELANRQLAAKVGQLVRDGVYPREIGFHAFAIAAMDQVSGAIRGPLVVLLAAVAVVLLIACANVAGLLLVRGERRRRELAVRVALGADSGRLTRLLFAETGVLAGLGAVGGLAVAGAGIVGIRRLVPASLARVADARLDPVLVIAALLVASLTAVLTGLLPAMQAARVAPADELREGARGTAGQGRIRWRRALVTGEVALTVVLVTGAGLLIRTVAGLLGIDPGFDPRGVLTMRLSTPSVWYADSARVAAFWTGLEREIAAIPGVKSVGSVRVLPLASEMGDFGVRVEGYTPPPNQGAQADWQILSPGAFPALGLRLREGRLLGPGDDLEGPLAMVVNQSFADAYVGGRSPLGVRVRIGGGTGPAYAIVGVVQNARHNTLTSAVKPGFYVTLPQFARAPGNTIRSMSLVVRTDDDPERLAAPVRAAVRRADPRLPISEVRTMEHIVGASIAAPRFAMQLLGGFGLMALVLSAIGIFGVVAHSVAIRHQEFGIRSALGARPSALLRLGLGSGLHQTAAGIAIGVGLALPATRLLGWVVSGVPGPNGPTFVAVVALIGTVAILASLIPALRAARTEPGVVLKAE